MPSKYAHRKDPVFWIITVISFIIGKSIALLFAMMGNEVRFMSDVILTAVSAFFSWIALWRGYKLTKGSDKKTP